MLRSICIPQQHVTSRVDTRDAEIEARGEVLPALSMACVCVINHMVCAGAHKLANIYAACCHRSGGER